MVAVGGRPILWHIMKIYASYRFNEFILALGYKGDVIKQYFLNYQMRNSDFTLVLGRDNDIEYHKQHDAVGWKITFADTGGDAITGARVARVAKYIDGDSFLLTYGDGLADINLDNLVDFHMGHGRIGTITGVHAPSRFGKLIIDKETDGVHQFTEKPMESGISDYINGGFFVFNREFLNYLDSDKSCILEREPLERLARDGELVTFRHDGYWQCMDTYRDWLVLEELWQSDNAPWKSIF